MKNSPQLFLSVIALLLCLLGLAGCATSSVLTEETFGTYTIETDPGLEWSIKDGVGQYEGVSRDKRWKGNHVVFPISIDTRTTLEISGKFMIPKSDGHQLVALWGLVDGDRDTDGPLCLYFEGSNGSGQYFIQTRWMNVPAVAIGRTTMPGFGDEEKRFHRMRILLNRAKSLITYSVDDITIGSVKYTGVIPPITKVQMDIEAPNKGTSLRVCYDDLSARSSGANRKGDRP